MNTIVHLNSGDERLQRQQEFRRQFASNFNAALDRRGSIPPGYGRVTAVAQLFDVSQNTATAWVRGDGVPELFRLPEIAKTLNTTVEQLVMGDAGTGAHIVDEQYAVIDLHPDNTADGHADYTLPETLREIGLPRDVKMMRVQSEDMEPYLRTGDIVVYDPRVTRIQTNGVYVLHVNDKFVVRRAQSGLKKEVRLICDNAKFSEEVLAPEDFAETPDDSGRVAVVGQILARVLLGR
jgi:transcriptional regulator with XRE-family HTH domain